MSTDDAGTHDPGTNNTDTNDAGTNNTAKNDSDTDSLKTVVIVSGEDFADAITVSSYTWWSASPLFLSSPTGLDDKAKSAIETGGFDRIVIVGDEVAVPLSVDEWASDVAPTIRLAGKNCYETCVEFAKWALGEGMQLNEVGIATGKNFPDALAGASLCGKRGAVILLADLDEESGLAALDLLAEYKDEIAHVNYLGGEASLPPELCTRIEAALR